MKASRYGFRQNQKSSCVCNYPNASPVLSSWVLGFRSAAQEPRQNCQADEQNELQRGNLKVSHVTCDSRLLAHTTEQQRYRDAESEGAEEEPFREWEGDKTHHDETDGYNDSGKFRVDLRDSERSGMRFHGVVLHGQHYTPKAPAMRC